MIKKEKGKKREFSTGAKRQAAVGKGLPSLFPGDAYIDISKHFEHGAEHYDARNWEKGLPLASIIDSLERHIAAEKMGLTDESHARALAWNAVVYLAIKLRIENGILPKELDDMPKYKKVEGAITCYKDFDGPKIRDMGMCDYDSETDSCAGKCVPSRLKAPPNYRAMGYCPECVEKILAANVGAAVQLCTVCGLLL